MRVPRIYVPDPLAAGKTLSFGAKAMNHVVRVLRLGKGAPLVLFNGAGGEFRAVVERVEARMIAVRVEAFCPQEVESPLTVILAQGVSRRERMDYTLQKAVELGAHAIQPLFTERSIVNLEGSRLRARVKHWQGVVSGACEQCGRNRIAAVLEPLSLTAWLHSNACEGTKLVLDPKAEQGLLTLPRPAAPITLLTGPEGGLNPHEIRSAGRYGFRRLRLGPRVMRTETAGIAALAALQVLWGDLG